MSIAVIFILVAIAIFMVIKNMWDKARKRIEKEQVSTYISDFSVSQYLERIEQDNIQILQEREKNPQYHLTLWIGLDGLRMNDDETYEWIRRKEKKALKKLPEQNVCESAMFSQQTRTFPAPILPTYNAMRILELQMQMQNTCIQHQMVFANQQIINSIQPMCAAVPVPYYKYGNQCCSKLPF